MNKYNLVTRRKPKSSNSQLQPGASILSWSSSPGKLSLQVRRALVESLKKIIEEKSAEAT